MSREFVLPRIWRLPAVVVRVVLPLAMMVVGLAVAVASATVFADSDETEALGAFGVELGAALWFAGGIALGTMTRSVRIRRALFAVLAIAGVTLIAVSVSRDWTGAGLELAMEFGVGAFAIVVIDTVIIDQIHRRLGTLADPDGPTVAITLDESGRPIAVAKRDVSPRPDA